MSRQTDHETGPQRDRLLSLALNGDQEALDRLLTFYMRMLYQAALRVLRSPQDAEDALQDGLLAAVRNLKKFEGRSRFSTWLTSIVINAALMRLRKARSQPATSIDEERPGRDHQPLADRIADRRPNPEELYAQEEEFRILDRHLESLPAANRSALVLRDFEGMGTGEAATALGLSTGTLKSQLHRGRARIIKEVRDALVPRGTFKHARTVGPMREVTEPAA